MNLTDAARRSVETGFGDAEANRFAANEDILAILDGYTHEMINFLVEQVPVRAFLPLSIGTDMTRL